MEQADSVHSMPPTNMSRMTNEARSNRNSKTLLFIEARSCIGRT